MLARNTTVGQCSASASSLLCTSVRKAVDAMSTCKGDGRGLGSTMQSERGLIADAFLPL